MLCGNILAAQPQNDGNAKRKGHKMSTAEIDKYAQNKELLRLAQDHDPQEAMSATEELIRNNMGLVRSVALRFRDRGTDLEDLIQIGIIGMMKAIRSFDIERDTAFSTYAVPLIIGEIQRHLRDDGLIKVSRIQRKLGVELMKARNRVLLADGREANIDELAHLCGVTVEEAAIALDAISPVTSLSDGIGDGESHLTLESRIADGESDIERLSDSIALGQAIDKLPLVWKKILILRYFKNMTQTETGRVLSMTQVSVSRKEAKALMRLKSLLK